MPIDREYAREVLRTEAAAIVSLEGRLGETFSRAAEMILGCRGRIVVTGMGKAGLIGAKISATLASTGTPSLFLHPAEAIHGDLGRVVRDDVVLALSNSGETDELTLLLPALKRIGTPILSITGSPQSTLGTLSDLCLDMGRIEEACPLGLAPSASTTAMLALGDALALTVLKARDFKAEDYAQFHPGGDLGRRLMKVGEIMRTGERDPRVTEAQTVQEALTAITKARAGAVTVVAADGRLAGIFTDGDLRRHIAGDVSVLRGSVGRVMTRHPVTVRPDALAVEALRILRERKIDELPVVDPEARPLGMLDVQDLLAAGLV